MAKMRICMLAAAVALVSQVAVPAARADNASDFLAMVSGQGINVGETPADVQITLAAAMEVCHLLHYGFTAEDARRQAHYILTDASPQQLANFVEAAQAKLCVAKYAPLQPGGDY